MAREYANIFTAIWRDRDFRALASADQRMYFVLVTQPDITAAGTLPLTAARWASLAVDTTADGVRASLGNLAAARFIGMDHTTEELLVRSFVRHDKGYSNRKRRPVILRAAEELVSPALALMLAEEFLALGLPTDALSDALSDRASDSRFGKGAEPPSGGGVEPSPEGSVLSLALSTHDSLFPQVDSLSDRASDATSDRTSTSDGVVVSNLSGSIPHPSTLTPAASGRAAASDGPTTPRKPKRAAQLPASWQPTDDHTKRAAGLGLDLAHQVELFRLHAETNGRTAKNWNAAFTTWLIKAPGFDRGSTTHSAPVPPKLPDNDAAAEWLRAEWTAGRVRQVEQRTGLHYPRPDLPANVSGREASERWATDHARQWITANHELIITRLTTRNAS
jgi:hypothetical protein